MSLEMLFTYDNGKSWVARKKPSQRSASQEDINKLCLRLTNRTVWFHDLDDTLCPSIPETIAKTAQGVPYRWLNPTWMKWAARAYRAQGGTYEQKVELWEEYKELFLGPDERKAIAASYPVDGFKDIWYAGVAGLVKLLNKSSVEQWCISRNIREVMENVGTALSLAHAVGDVIDKTHQAQTTYRRIEKQGRAHRYAVHGDSSDESNMIEKLRSCGAVDILSLAVVPSIDAPLPPHFTYAVSRDRRALRELIREGYTMRVRTSRSSE